MTENQMPQAKPKRYLRNLLLDRRFQLKYTLAVVLISSIISLGLGMMLYQSHRESSRVASLDDPDLDGELRAQLAAEDRKVLIYLFIFLGGLVLSLTALGIVATHKIAGPAYAMRRTLSQIADGSLPHPRNLRRGDELVEVAGELKRMAEALRSREEKELALLEQALAALEAEPGRVKQMLELLLEGKKKRLQ